MRTLLGRPLHITRAPLSQGRGTTGEMHLQRFINISGDGKPLLRITLDLRGKVSKIDHHLGGKDEQALVLIEAFERLRKSHGLADRELRTMLPWMASAGMPPAMFATEIAATLEELGAKVPDDEVTIDIGAWRGTGN